MLPYTRFNCSPRSRWLVCLDLQREHVVPGRPGYAPRNTQVVAACRRLLEHARARRWRVIHSQLRVEASPLLMFGAPIEGLRPLVTEPVFFRQGLSAFANPAFRETLRGARGAEVFAIGFSLADTCLATALAAIDEGLAPTLVEDAIGTGADEGIGEAARAVLQPLLTISTSSRLFTGDLEAVR